MRFLPWHLGFFCRYRPLPEERFAEQSRQHPLLQSRLDAGPFASSLDRLLADAREDVHRKLAEVLIGAASGEEALAEARALAEVTPPDDGKGEARGGMREVAG
jgi:hypothetical protein